MKRKLDATDAAMRKRARHVVSNTLICDMPSEFWTVVLRPHLDYVARGRLRVCCLGLHGMDLDAVIPNGLGHWLAVSVWPSPIAKAIAVVTAMCRPADLWALRVACTKSELSFFDSMPWARATFAFRRENIPYDLLLGVNHSGYFYWTLCRPAYLPADEWSGHPTPVRAPFGIPGLRQFLTGTMSAEEFETWRRDADASDDV